MGKPGRSHLNQIQFSSVTQSCWLFVTPWTAVCQASLFITNFWSVRKLMSITLVMPSNHLIFCRPLLLPLSIFPSIRVFSNELVLRIRWPKYWSFSFLPMSIQDWFPLGCTIGSPCWPGDSQESPPTPQLKSINFRHSAFFIDQLAHPYMTTGKTIALTRWTFVGKVMSLLFNMLSRFVIAFLPRSKCL